MPGVLDELFACPQHLVHRDGTRQCGIFNKVDKLVAHRRDNALDDLQQRYLEENLALGHAEHLTGLILAARDTLNAAAEDLREVAGVVDDERHQRSGEARQGNIPTAGQDRRK